MTLSSVLAGWRDEAAAQKGRLFLWAPVAFAGGIAFYYGLPVEPPASLGARALIAFMGAAAALYRRQYDRAGYFLAFYLCVAGVLASAGFLAAKISTDRVGTKILERGIGPVDLEGTVESVERLGPGEGSRAVLTDLVIERLDGPPQKVRLKFRKDEGLAPGARVRSLVRLDPPSGPVLPGAYDFRRHLFFEGIGGVGFAYRAAEVVAVPETGGVALFFERLRISIDAKIRNATGAATGGIVSALITGERGAIDEADNDAMRESGLYHLLSISGTHVSMVAGVLFFTIRLCLAGWPTVALRYPIKKIAAAAAMAGAAFYVFLAGADVPAQRALLMTGLVLFAIMIDRSPFSLRLIAFSALVVLAFAPFALLGVSFQMSYAAVAALICFFEWTRPWWTKWRSRAGMMRKGILYLLAVLITSLIAGAMTGLYSLYHFQSFSVTGVAANMIAVPLTGAVIMPAAVAAMIAMPFGLEAAPLAVMDWGVSWMLGCAHWFADIDGGTVHVRQWPEATFAFIVIGTVLFLVWEGWRGKGIAIALLCAGLLIGVTAARPDVLVSQDGGLIGLTDADGNLYISTGRKDRFTAENWMRLLGQEGEKTQTFAAKGSPVLCDDDGCRMERDGVKVSILKTRSALAEDCGWADLLIAQMPVRLKECDGVHVIDRYDVKDDGAHAVFLRDGRIIIKKTADHRRVWNINDEKN